MPFKVATHGGRFLNVNKDFQLHEDTNYDMSRTPSDLEAEGTTFSTDEEGRLTDADGKKHVVFNTHRDGLMLNRLSVENEWSLQAVDNKKYLYAGMEGLSLEDEPGAMGVFTLVQQ